MIPHLPHQHQHHPPGLVKLEKNESGDQNKDDDRPALVDDVDVDEEDEESSEFGEGHPVKVHVSICKKGSCDEIKENYQVSKRSSRRKREANLGPLCEMEVNIQAFETNYTLCLYVRKFEDSDVVKNKYNEINVTVFKEGNLTLSVPLYSK